MTTHQAGAVLMAPQDYDDPAVVKAAAAELGRLGGLARAKRLTAEERAVSARHAARMRWGMVRKKGQNDSADQARPA